MNEIIVIAGFSAAGKDTIAKLVSNSMKYKFVISCTTRPKRDEETEGIDYNFISDNEMCSLALNNKLIEYREYNSVIGRWFYGIAKESIVNDEKYIVVVDIDGARALKKYFGNRVKLIFIDASEPVRCKRASRNRKNFCIKEWSRRYNDDIAKFPEETIKKEFDLIVDNNSDDMFNAVEKIEDFCRKIKDQKTKKDFKDSVYLYGEDISAYANMAYKDVLLTKIKLGSILMNKLVHIENMENSTRMYHVNKAIEFNRNLLKEIKLSNKDIYNFLKNEREKK